VTPQTDPPEKTIASGSEGFIIKYGRGEACLARKAIVGVIAIEVEAYLNRTE